MRLAENSQAGVEGNVDQTALVAGGLGDLVTLGLAKSGNTVVGGNVDQAVGSGFLLLAGSVAEDGAAKANGDTHQAGGLGTLDAMLTSKSPSKDARGSAYSRKSDEGSDHGLLHLVEMNVELRDINDCSVSRLKVKKEWTLRTAKRVTDDKI